MIVFTVLFSVDFPLNAYKIMIAIMKLTNLDIIDTENFLNSVFTFKVEAPSINAIFSEAGYESSNFIIELGPIFIIIFGSLCLYLCQLLLLLATRNCRENCLTRRLRKRISVSVIVVRFLIESCIEIGLVALIGIVMVEKQRFDYFQDGLSVVLAFIALICLGLAPIYLLKVGKRYIYKPLSLSEH